MLSLNRRAFLTSVAASVVSLPARGAPQAGPRVIEARAGKAKIGPAETDILGFDGVTPGPVLRYKQGEDLAVRLVNKLDLPASIHWHGMRGENAMDGVAPLTQAAVAPGGSFDYRRKLTEPGLFCYRPSVYGKTPELIGRGLKGLLVVDEPDPLPVDHDLLLVLDDWRLDAQGKIEGSFADAGDARAVGRLGPMLAVNGKAAPATAEFQANSRVRLRLANLANARIMVLTFDGVQPFVVAIDSQPCEAFEPVRRSIPVAPGARFELIFDMPATEGAKARVILRGPNNSDSEILVATAKGARAEKRGLIYSLPSNPALPAEIKLNNAKKIDLVIEPGPERGPGWIINGAATKGYDGPPLFSVKRGTPVTLGYVNKSKVPLAMHVHGHAMRLLHDLDDGWEPYWRNGVIIPAAKTKHVSFIAEAPGKWAIHDDILEHEAAGLATWFETL
ncbi:multicopper oxidase family protein [Methylocystis sp. MJC1]|jgi:FtsP/CotA-like multicopper oxidase with cupredoxin domain|uniref:multicopper oxidase family protein n=1 Tax=Methylocystis sp. MJC1 TaxID=2654282 RepID=UPI0013EAAFC6|nr:multicopper oxidase family protein [Methylocystis sp. MJC1]KAF2992300.1 Multicopper oxidase MmcO [Methylocystis sp. MJC1]MBU6527439.1 multicopper oxidase family protein [Methylocystis sp. MJC1]UZX10385.1 multicopper oxidase family protein [Methylocystis sp. MJC1]